MTDSFKKSRLLSNGIIILVYSMPRANRQQVDYAKQGDYADRENPILFDLFETSSQHFAGIDCKGKGVRVYPFEQSFKR